MLRRLSEQISTGGATPSAAAAEDAHEDDVEMNEVLIDEPAEEDAKVADEEDVIMIEPLTSATTDPNRPLLEDDKDQLLAVVAKQQKIVKLLKRWLAEHGYDYDEIIAEAGGVSYERSISGLVERAAKRARQARDKGDIEGFFKELKSTRDGSFDSHGIEVCYNNLNVSVMGNEGEGRGYETVTSVLLRIVQSFVSKQKKVEVPLLQNVSGILRPGRLTLLLGPPGCGKTTLMRCLAGKLGKHKQEGSILYNGVEGNRKDRFFLNKTVAYIDQEAHHIPTLTVRETFEFAFQALIGANAGVTQPRREVVKEIGTRVDNIINFLGLQSCEDTIVGDDLLRGVSGGQKRRVTTGEMLAGDFNVILADEISTGLDAATTFDVVHILKVSSVIFNVNTVISLLQPAPEVFDLFDDVILMDAGQVVYHGPREEILPYFESLGFKLPPLKDAADFLQEVTTKDGQNYSSFGQPGGPKTRPPHTTAGFVERFQESKIYKDMKDVLDAPPVEESFHRSATMEFSGTWWDDFKLCYNRALHVKKTDKATLRTRIMQQIIVGGFVAAIFANLEQEDFRGKYGVLFVAIMSFSLGSMQQMPASFAQRAVFYKQRDASFFRTSAYTVANGIVQIPQSLLEIFIWTSIVYFSVGLTDSNGGLHYLAFIAIATLASVVMSQFFQNLVALLPSSEVALPMSAAFVVVFVLFSGYVIAEENIDPWWIWIYYLNPTAHAFTAMAQNEFLSSAYDDEIPIGGGETIREGDLYLENQGVTTDAWRTDVAIVALLGFYAMFFVTSSMFLHRVRFTPHGSGGYGDDQEEEGSFFVPSPARSIRKLPTSDPEEGGTAAGSPLEVTRVDLSWENLSYTVGLPDHSELELLHNVSGYAQAGTLTALMGSSGAGKTTLMDVIAGRKTGGHITGNVRVDGYTLDKQTFSRLIGYCEQTDIHAPMLTFIESLYFSARLRLPDETSDADVKAHVESIVQSLDLDGLRDLQVKQAAGEQAKRLTIGVELAANPSILFLDEPTSGLDSRAAVLVMRAIKQAASQGRAVVATIHQPSQWIFDQFDNLLLLKRGGCTVYFGELGDGGETIVKYFTSVPSSPPYQAGTNPAVYMLDCIGAGTSTASTMPISFESWFLHSPFKALLDHRLEEPGFNVPGKAPKLESAGAYASSLGQQVRLCLWRADTSYFRSPQYNVTRLLVGIFVGLLFGLVFFQQDYDDFATAYSRIALLYMTTLFLGVVSYISAIGPFYEARAVFYRERAANMYRSEVYNMSIAVAEVPYIALVCMVFCVVYYFTVGLQATAGHFFEYYLYVLLWVAVMTFYGQFVVALMPTRVAAMAVGAGIVQLFNLFAGFIAPPQDINPQIQFFHWASPMHYVFEGLLTSQFHDDHTDVTFVNPAVGTVTIGMNEFVKLQFPDFDREHQPYDLGLLVAFMLFFRFGTFMALQFVNHLKR
uniref:ABC transporter domain-containing protein n=1 Tax=Phaeomonas parva TaxID=124430 RepID=A0A7S1TP17_9STRA|mmetsp:Transcript_11132/g.33886  ORF Transcript_11132/g.33886 Transcript_11132/m.33886 type:complete len:1441 (+) Transcript_11132:189-4511(+)|eukprot:CAMPEP_0118862498 /NCGR_PEP_ID=MMETSP1163-20130328/7684_1 /TAXON_ID=124430 /ORGANISM="Phaeomonas parva, Strain CCMP2877" /LENGTH=1440 /DNA_ID=CAMNT_0006796413 /DNA_START=83 /DNA_END=4405 /DNA_ORIENTATION=+